jgi:hypothetical protein
MWNYVVIQLGSNVVIIILKTMIALKNHIPVASKHIFCRVKHPNLVYINVGRAITL